MLLFAQKSREKTTFAKPSKQSCKRLPNVYIIIVVQFNKLSIYYIFTEKNRHTHSHIAKKCGSLMSEFYIPCCFALF